jgi:predicted nucleic acid-binding protein
MLDRAFLDTNVLVYAFTSNDPRKAIAEELILDGGVVGVQTLNEFVNVERNKVKASWSTILDWLRIINKLCPPPVPLTMETHHRGLQITQAFGYHIYDSLMLGAALEASCTIFYSEDMQDGQTIDTLTIVNPFTRRKVSR